MISESLRRQVEKKLGQSIDNIQPVSGGSINKAAKVTTVKNEYFFLKWNTSAAADMFPKEEKGLKLLNSANSELRIPEVIGSGSTQDDTEFLVMEYIQEGSVNSKSAQSFGERLARLHKKTDEQYGLYYDNYIGKLPQLNTKHENWTDFFIKERLEPQLKMAVDHGKFSPGINAKFQLLYSQLPGILTDEPPALLHGDLWGGNYFYDTEGKPVIYDPAVYYGNREVELAFTHLFGGFSSGFYNTYEELFPIKPGFMNERKDIYNLYPLLVHTNLFGGHYARQVKSIVKRFI